MHFVCTGFPLGVIAQGLLEIEASAGVVLGAFEFLHEVATIKASRCHGVDK